MRAWLGAIAIVWMGAGCSSASYYVVRSRLVQSARPDPPEVVETGAYGRSVAGVKRIALRAPDRCAQQTAASVTGGASTEGIIMQTRCGVEMAELERAFSQSGYEIVSWRAVADTAFRDKITPLDAARKYGAQLLIQVNSLEKSTADASKDARRERRFFHSDAIAGQGEPATVNATRANSLELLVSKAEQEGQWSRQAVTVDISVILVETGETIWFYRWTNIEEAAEAPETAIHVVCGGGKCNSAPVVKRESDSVEEMRSGSIVAISAAGRPADARNAVYYQLVRETVADIVQRFTSKRGSAAASAKEGG